MKLRALAAGTALAVATTLGGGAIFTAVDASTAAAKPAQGAPLTTTVPTCGNAVTTFTNCTVTIKKFAMGANRTLQAVGTFTATDATGTPVTDTFTAAVANPPSCPILSLTLGPLHLDVLGLVVDIPNAIVINITAVPGPGNLLGNLLCAVANLLNGSGSTTALTNLINLLNGILAGL